MVATIKSINIHCRNMITIPKRWRTEFKIEIGGMVSLQIENNQIVIQQSSYDSKYSIGIVGRDGTVHIPKELRDHFHSKGLRNFIVSFDKSHQKVILTPLQ